MNNQVSKVHEWLDKPFQPTNLAPRRSCYTESSLRQTIKNAKASGISNRRAKEAAEYPNIWPQSPCSSLNQQRQYFNPKTPSKNQPYNQLFNTAVESNFRPAFRTRSLSKPINMTKEHLRNSKNYEQLPSNFEISSETTMSYEQEL